MADASSCYELASAYVSQYKGRANTSMVGNVLGDLLEHGHYSGSEPLLVGGLAVLFTACRILYCSSLCTAVASGVGLPADSRAKFGESAWKLTYYFWAWMFAVYLLLFPPKYPYFYDPDTIFNDWRPGLEIPTDIWVLYIVQTSFYVHSVYASLYMDQWRKDSIPMLFHHLVTILLLVCSYLLRLHKMGAIVLVTHDICDVMLESGKLSVYMKGRAGRQQFFDHLSTLCFAGFFISWAVFRLYFYPTRAIYVVLCIAPKVAPKYMVPSYVFFAILLIFILVLNVYWFMFILKMLVKKVLLGQEIEDVRETEEEMNGSDNNNVTTNNNKIYKEEGVNGAFSKPKGD